MTAIIADGLHRRFALMRCLCLRCLLFLALLSMRGPHCAGAARTSGIALNRQSSSPWRSTTTTPYVFRDASGSLTGYLVDSWRLRKPGWASNCSAATRRRRSNTCLADRQARVIDTMFRTPARERTLDFLPPYEPIPVSIYTHSSISGIADPSTLRGFLSRAKPRCLHRQAHRRRGQLPWSSFSNYPRLRERPPTARSNFFSTNHPPTISSI